jgi:2-C-methyl-D-erythritol 2,4-cyclodiphosphate synthase
MKIRAGIGFDVHQLGRNRKLILGGIDIPSEQGIIAHSDGDVLIHAIIDALLGALGLGDIGTFFPDTDMQYKDIKSTVLLEKVKRMVDEKGFTVCNVDSVVSLQTPKLRTHIDDMRKSIASVLQVDPEDVSVKATSTEMLGYVGRQEGIAAHAIVLLHSK